MAEATNHWAIIIGIDYYPADRSLRGSVKDANAVKGYLESRETPVHIVTLTATTPSDVTSGVPVEAASSWPNRLNVIQALKRVIKEANPGDLVYIHYSGHGTRILSEARQGSQSVEELALVLFEADEIGESYLRGRHLASALKQMVDKGLVVTVLLDCCFSGSVPRHEDQLAFAIRTVDYKSNVAALAAEADDEEFGEFSVSQKAPRSVSAQQDWIINPDGYTIISACGPYERAFEVDLGAHGRMGALTHLYFEILNAQTQGGRSVAQETLHAHLCARFHCIWPQQTPMLYGNMYRTFFSDLIRREDPKLIPLYRAAGGRLRLRAGLAHGISPGDEFAVVSSDTSERAVHTVLRVSDVGTFTSEMVAVEASQAETARDFKTGWSAKLVGRASPSNIRVRIPRELSEDHEYQAAVKDLLFVDPVLSSRAERFGLVVRINEHNHFEVLDALGDKLHDLPTVPKDLPRAAAKILRVLQHVSSFKVFQGIENRLPNAAFRASYDLSCSASIGQDGTFRATHGETWHLTVRNTRSQPLFFYIFNLTSSWEISNLVSDSGGGAYYVVPPREGNTPGWREVPLQMDVPGSVRMQGEKSCKDIMKTFVTNRPILFAGIVQGKITVDGSAVGQRGTNSTNGILELLSKLSQSIRGDTESDGEEWETETFIIQTSI